MTTELFALERLFWTAVCGRAAPEEVDRAFVGRGALDARARIAIYARMYVARQVNALRDAYPKLALRLGERFERLARDYLRVHPSRDPAIERVGARLSAFVGERDPGLAALARLEWARQTVLLAPEPIALARRSELDPDRATLATLELTPALAVVQVLPDTLAIWDDPSIDSSSSPAGSVAVLVAAWRASSSVFHRALDADEATALATLAEGGSLAGVCAAFCDAPDAAQRAALVLGRWFDSRWIGRVRYPAEGFEP